MPRPKPTLIRKNMMLLALAAALSALGPISRPIQTALIEALSDWRMLEPRFGSENRNRVRAIGPSVSTGAARRPAGGTAGASEDAFGSETWVRSMLAFREGSIKRRSAAGVVQIVTPRGDFSLC